MTQSSVVHRIERELPREPRAEGVSSGPLLPALLEALPEGLALYGLDLKTLHTNRTFDRMLAADPAGEEVRREIRSLLRVLCRKVRWSGAAEPETREVGTAAEHYLLRGACLCPDRRDGAVLVSLRRLRPEPLGDAELRARFGLTVKEIEVARLIAEGRSNDSLARSLFISPHTARHHTERVLKKLQVRSRAEVAPRLIRSPPALEERAGKG